MIFYALFIELLNGLNRSPCMADTQGIFINIDGNLEKVTQVVKNSLVKHNLFIFSLLYFE